MANTRSYLSLGLTAFGVIWYGFLWFILYVFSRYATDDFYLIAFAIITVMAYNYYKGLGKEVRDALIVTPALIYDAESVFAPGNYDYRVIEDRPGSTTGARYIVLVRPAGKKGFTLKKTVYTVNDYPKSLQDEALDLASVSPEAFKEVHRKMRLEEREASRSEFMIGHDLKKVEEVAELIKS
jgi:hypothetical protein